MVSSGVENVDPETAEGGRMRSLVCIETIRGTAKQIPTLSRYPLCKSNLKLSLWQIEGRLVNKTLISRLLCHRPGLPLRVVTFGRMLYYSSSWM